MGKSKKESPPLEVTFSDPQMFELIKKKGGKKAVIALVQQMVKEMVESFEEK